MVFNPFDLNTMKTVAHCFGRSKDICKSFGEHSKRLTDKKVLKDPTYTLGNVSDDDLLKKWNQEQDPWTKLALRNRVRNEVEETRKIHCVPQKESDGTLINVERVGRHLPDKVKDCSGPNCVGLPLSRGTMAAPAVGGVSYRPSPPGPGIPPPPPPRIPRLSRGPNQTFSRLPAPAVPGQPTGTQTGPPPSGIGTGTQTDTFGSGGTGTVVVPPSIPVYVPPFYTFFLSLAGDGKRTDRVESVPRLRASIS